MVIMFASLIWWMDEGLMGCVHNREFSKNQAKLNLIDKVIYGWINYQMYINSDFVSPKNYNSHF